ncbi:MAG: diacylglycerol kinase family lipid kinase [Lachnospiraceae bacterium]|nr:diacylglycerol kinase family lipid kinase [Lachnospiraceae bacterium]
MLYFIVNEKSKSGKGTRIWKELRTFLEKQNIPYEAWTTEYKNHAALLAKKICEKNDKDIRMVVIGGDGTINETINGITDFTNIRFGVIPNGSGNDFARGLKLSGTPLECLKRILNSTSEESIDLGQVTWDDTKKPYLFAISSGVGMDALVCKNTDTSRLKEFLNMLHLGKLSYLMITVYSLFSMTTSHMTARFDEQEPQDFPKLLFAASMNFHAEGGGVPMAPRATARDGKLSVCAVHNIPKWLTFFYLPILAAARHERLPGVRMIDCKTLELTLDSPMTLHADGEYLGDVTKVRYECLPGKLRILV